MARQDSSTVKADSRTVKADSGPFNVYRKRPRVLRSPLSGSFVLWGALRGVEVGVVGVVVRRGKRRTVEDVAHHDTHSFGARYTPPRCELVQVGQVFGIE